VVSNEDWKGAVVRTAVLMPWERARRERILNAYFDLYLSTADVKYPGQLNRIRAIQTEDYQPFDSWMPITSEDQREQKRRVAELVRNDLILRYLVHTVLDRDVRRDLPLCQLRATELELALLLYQHRHQRPAVSLRELVPDFLPAVPVDPFSGSPFNYRLAAEEEWLPWEENVRLDRAGDWGVANIASNLGGRYRPVTATDHGFTYRRVRPGHGVVWSIGPDGIDSGGKQQLRLADINVRGMSRMITNEDFLFIVPRIVK
jgi:hypothetical protein